NQLLMINYINHLCFHFSKCGTLKGFDQTINLILDESHERVFSSSQGVEQVVLGLYIVRGDNVAVIGEIDEETDSALDLGNIRAEPLNSVVH
uniref:U6 snRNA-associated Sm-like protein LSm8 n=1 Tax=Accipiter nisus TaxID=211598 RepID=A0A8B9MJJ3_9AVES